jgi:hypothetical protein
MLFVLDVLDTRDLAGMACDVGFEIEVIVNLSNNVSQTFASGVSISQGTDEQTAPEDELLIEGYKLLHLQGYTRVAFLDELLKSGEGLRSQGGLQLLAK